MNNYEKIKNYSIEEMAEFLGSKTICQRCEDFFGECIYGNTASNDVCIESMLNLLKSESEE